MDWSDWPCTLSVTHLRKNILKLKFISVSLRLRPDCPSEGLRTLPNEGQDCFIGLQAMGEERGLSPVAIAAYLGTGEAFGFPVGDDGEVRC